MPLSPASATYSILTLLWRLLGYSTSLGQASVGQVESLLPPSPPSPPRSQGWAGSAGFQLLCLPLLSLGAFQDQSLPDNQAHLVFPGTAAFTIQTIRQHT